MPIKEVDNHPNRWRAVGAIRMGRQTENGRAYALDTIRLTSPYEGLLKDAADLWGGDVQPWENPHTGEQEWEVVTDTSEIPVFVPPQDIRQQQNYELHGGGGIKRRCDGETEEISEGACLCAQEDGERQCDPVTRLNVIVPDLPDIGVWRLRTTSWYGALELHEAVRALRHLMGAGQLPEASLAIENRVKKVQGESNRHFAVPVLRVERTPRELMQMRSGGEAPEPLDTGNVAEALQEGDEGANAEADRADLPEGDITPSDCRQALKAVGISEDAVITAINAEQDLALKHLEDVRMPMLRWIYRHATQDDLIPELQRKVQPYIGEATDEQREPSETAEHAELGF